MPISTTDALHSLDVISKGAQLSSGTAYSYSVSLAVQSVASDSTATTSSIALSLGIPSSSVSLMATARRRALSGQKFEASVGGADELSAVLSAIFASPLAYDPPTVAAQIVVDGAAQVNASDFNSYLVHHSVVTTSFTETSGSDPKNSNKTPTWTVVGILTSCVLAACLVVACVAVAMDKTLRKRRSVPRRYYSSRELQI